MRKRTGLALLATVTILLGAATSQSIPGGEAGKTPDDPAYSLDEYKCLQCHAGAQNARLPLTEVLRLIPGERPEAPLQTPFPLTLGLENPWLGDLQQMEATLDLSGAPSLGFSSGLDPLLGESTAGTLNATREDDVAVAGTVPFPSALGTRKARVEVEIPSNATDVVLRLVPDNTDAPLGPDLRMAIWPTKHRERTEPWQEVDDAGPGKAETFQIQGTSAIADAGLGIWIVEARMASASNVPPEEAASATAPQPFTVVVDAWFNTTGERAQVGTLPDLPRPPRNDADDGTIDSPTRLDATWTLVATQPPVADETVVLSVYLHQFYNHDNPGANPNNGYFVQNFTIPVAVTEEGQVALLAAPAAAIAVRPPGLGELTVSVGQIIGYTTAFLLVAALLSGGVLGKGSRRVLNRLFGTARRRVHFHNTLSYALTLAALAHMILFLVESLHHWTMGLIWGGLSILCLLGLGVTGAMQVPMIRRWDYGTWRWTHFGLAIGSVLFVLLHIFLDSTNFGTIQDALGWRDPLSPTNG